MKNLVVAVLLMTSGMVYAQTQSRVVEVVGEASIKIQPDRIHLQVMVDEIGSDPTQTQKKVMNTMAEIIGYLKSNEGITAVQTNRIMFSPRYNSNQDIREYSARQILTFTISDVNLYDATVIELFKLGVNGVNHIQYSSSEIDQVRLTARMQAIENARTKAAMMASALGQELGEAVFISDNSNTSTFGYSRPMEAKYLSSSSSIETGTIEVSESISVHFELK